MLMGFSLIASVAAIVPPASRAQHYAYVNDDDNGTNNIVTALSVNAQGQMRFINTYATGGLGTGGHNSLTSITTAKTGSNVCLYASNGGSSNVSAFTMSMTDGTLTSVIGSPFASGGTGTGSGIGLAVGKDKLLFAGNTASNNISVFTINSDCSLTLGQTYSTAGSPDAMKVTPTARFLIQTNVGAPPDSWRITYSNGTLREMGPFTAQGIAQGLDISCDGTTAYVGDEASYTQIEVYNIGASGGLTEINNYTNTSGQDSDNVLLSPDGTLLYVGETGSNQVETLSVGTGGALTFDSVASLNAGPAPSLLGLAVQKNDKYIFAAEVAPGQIGVLSVSGTALAEVANSPFSLHDAAAGVVGVVAYPRDVCQ